jgi:hypothetical protein
LARQGSRKGRRARATRVVKPDIGDGQDLGLVVLRVLYFEFIVLRVWIPLYIVTTWRHRRTSVTEDRTRQVAPYYEERVD